MTVPLTPDPAREALDEMTSRLREWVQDYDERAVGGSSVAAPEMTQNYVRIPEARALLSALAERDALREELRAHSACADCIVYEAAFHLMEQDDLHVTVDVDCRDITIWVNDVFAPAADSETFPLDNAVELWAIYREDNGRDAIIELIRQRRDAARKAEGGET